jgi:tRNA(Ile)-lysidine synthase
MSIAEKIKEKVSEYIISKKLTDNHTTPVLCAVSGGIDSVVMTHVLHTMGFKIAIAHCNFKLRGKDADKDEMFVKKLAEKINVPFYTTSFETKAFAENNKISVQMAARQLRYEWLENIRKKHGFHRIATAHHLNDSIETILLNLIKGTGISGIKGIAPQQGYVIRPLLCLTKNEIEHYAKKESIKYRKDISNKENKYERNKIRNKIYPLLKELNPSLENTFLNNINHLNDAYELMQHAIRILHKKMIENRKGNYFIAIKKLQQLPGWKTLLHDALIQFHFTHAQINEAQKLIQAPPGKHISNESYRLIKDREFLIITPQQVTPDISPIYVIPHAGKKTVTPHFTLKTEIKKFKGIQHKSARCLMQFDAEKVAFPLVLRQWKAGDYFFPLGMNKKKKISDFLIDEKVSVLEKEKTYVLISDERIICVLGRRIDHRFKTDAHTKKVLLVKIKY